MFLIFRYQWLWPVPFKTRVKQRHTHSHMLLTSTSPRAWHSRPPSGAQRQVWMPSFVLSSPTSCSLRFYKKKMFGTYLNTNLPYAFPMRVFTPPPLTHMIMFIFLENILVAHHAIGHWSPFPPFYRGDYQ